MWTRIKRTCLIAIALFSLVYLYLYGQLSYKEMHDSKNGTPRYYFHSAANASVGGLKMVAKHGVPVQTIEMKNVYEKLAFDNKPGGVWKQGFPIEYSMDHWSEEKPLEVFVLPHSHQDPGWILTLEEYFIAKTKGCLDSTLYSLKKNSRARFIYAEIAFFSMWVDHLNAELKMDVKRLLHENRLEISTGGWVMTDEATVHHYSMIDQLIEGRQWLKNNFDYTPQTGWSIDPFGQSTTMAYFLNKLRINSTLIQRVHYEVKKYLAERQSLEFIWRQPWDHAGQTEIFTHMMPFFSYDVPHTCGPDPSICCQFDFERTSKNAPCPWKKNPIPITEYNVADRAKMLADQYRKKAMLFNNGGVLFVPLGDDFRYLHTSAWDSVLGNMTLLMDYLNSHPEERIHVQFGTLSEYFQAVHKRASIQPLEKPIVKQSGDAAPFPRLVGDLFTYADVAQDYWSGYFTSRPSQKLLTRVLESELRSAEFLYTYTARFITKLREHSTLLPLLITTFNHLTFARRNLGLFQHHDGVTGTSTEHVVSDYSKKLLEALSRARSVSSFCAAYLLLMKPSLHPSSKANPPEPAVSDLLHKLSTQIPSYPGDGISPKLSFDDFRSLEDQMFEDDAPELTPITVVDADGKLKSDSLVYLFNPMAYARSVIVSLTIPLDNVFYVLATSSLITETAIPLQLEDRSLLKQVSRRERGLNKIYLGPLDLPPMTLVPVRIDIKKDDRLTNIVRHTIFNSNEKELLLESPSIKLTFDPVTGLLQSWLNKRTGVSTKFMVDFVSYRPTMSGAYIFTSNQEAQPVDLQTGRKIVVVRGPIVDEVYLSTPAITHTVRLYKHANNPELDYVDIENLISLSAYGHISVEVAMRIQSDVNNTDGVFYTDSNCFQLVRRQYHRKLPLQGNLYPVTCAAYIEDRTSSVSAYGTRLNLLTKHSLGLTSSHSGEMLVWLDRQSIRDDNRGLKGFMFGKWVAKSYLRIMVERVLLNTLEDINRPVPTLSKNSHRLLIDLTRPVVRFEVASSATALFITDPSKKANPFYGLLNPSFQLPCDYELIMLKTYHMPNDAHNPTSSASARARIGTVIRRLDNFVSTVSIPGETVSHNCRSRSEYKLIVKDVFGKMGFTRSLNTALDLIPDDSANSSKWSNAFHIDPMELEAFVLA